MAYEGMEKLKLALQDFQKALSLQPTAIQASEAIRRIKMQMG